MKGNKKGAISFEQIVLFILAIVVLVLVIAYFTGTFQRLQTPVNFTIGEVERGIECQKACNENSESRYTQLNCESLTQKTFANCK